MIQRRLNDLKHKIQNKSEALIKYFHIFPKHYNSFYTLTKNNGFLNELYTCLEKDKNQKHKQLNTIETKYTD